MHLIVHLFVHLINQMFVGRMQMLERLTPDVTSIWREGGWEGGRDERQEGGRGMEGREREMEREK